MINVKQILKTMSLRAGVTEAQISSSVVEGAITGYVIDGFAPTVGVFDPLFRLFTVSGADVDNIYFTTRQDTAVRTINYEELVELENEQSLMIERQQETELPNSALVQYMDPEIRYHQAAQEHRRQSGKGTGQISTGGTIVMTAKEAQKAARRLLYSMHAGRNSISFKTSTQHADLIPGDSISVETPGLTLTIVITDREISDKNTISWRGIEVAPAVQNTIGVGWDNPQIDQTFGISGTQIVILDIPLLRDEDNVYGYYFAGYPTDTTVSWTGALVETKINTHEDTSFTSIGTVTQAPVVGITDEALPAPRYPEMIDNENTLDITLSNGSLTSSTEEAVTTDGTVNLMAVGSELIQFITATDNGGDSWTLSGLLRGRFGTEVSADFHNTGETVILLTTDGSVLRATSNADEHLQIIDYKATSLFVSSQVDTGDFELTNIGLRPYPPAYITVERNSSGDATITWERRSRLSTGLFQQPPLGETTEAYSLGIYKAGQTVIGRTVSVSDTREYVYTAAQQTADGFTGTHETLDIVVYQESEIYGNGPGFRATGV